VLGRLTGRRMGMLVVKSGPAHFGPLAELCVSGDVEIHIDRTFALEDVPLALSYVGEGKTLGKVVVEVAARRSNGPQANE
ncbi:MAG TPA: zinc-binding dehydrogenase, partial [Acidimicrobiia bacterium]|nr:zinc-binding dehydrogenase [Acidimicrobiia bacterium]